MIWGYGPSHAGASDDRLRGSAVVLGQLAVRRRGWQPAVALPAWRALVKRDFLQVNRHKFALVSPAQSIASRQLHIVRSRPTDVG
jgi:hypothetical protein